jgi:hypothetical protein
MHIDVRARLCFGYFSGDKVQKGKHAWQFGPLILYTVLLGCFLLAFSPIALGWSQPLGNGPRPGSANPQSTPANALRNSLPHVNKSSIVDFDTPVAWQHLPVSRISFEGVAQDRLKPLSDHLAQTVDSPLSREKIAQSLRELFATGLFETIEADATRNENGIAVVFKGTPRMFVGAVTVNGAKGATMNTQLASPLRNCI